MVTCLHSKDATCAAIQLFLTVIQNLICRAPRTDQHGQWSSLHNSALSFMPIQKNSLSLLDLHDENVDNHV